MEDKAKKDPQDIGDTSPEENAEDIGMIEVLKTKNIDDLKGELEDWKSKAEEYLDGWQRSRAEFANYKKRIDREQAQAYQNAAGSIFKRFLDVLDDLELALKNLPHEGEAAEWSAGVELAHRKFMSILEAEGVSLIDAEGQEFDPNLHEAMSHEEAEGIPGGQIIEVVKNGYLLGERVLRPAVVRVAK
jgi:molecular chaperone GrpE